MLKIAFLFCLLAFPAWGQSAVTTYPLGVATVNGSGSILLTGSFQQVFAQTSNRKNCVIQNTGTHTMWVFFGAIGSATQPTSFPLFPAAAAGSPGGYVACANSGVVATDQVSITGTTGDTFTAVSQ